MGKLKDLYTGIKLLMKSPGLPFMVNYADRQKGDLFLRREKYQLALAVYERAWGQAADNELILDEAICILRIIEILPHLDGKDDMLPGLYSRLLEIETLLGDRNTLACLPLKYDCQPDGDDDVARVKQGLVASYFGWFLSESQSHTSNLHYREAIICSKAALAMCRGFSFFDYEQEMETLFSLGVIYGNIRKSGDALDCYNECISVAREHHDRALEFVAIVRKLSTLLVISHIDAYLDYDIERDATMRLLLELTGNRSYEEFTSQLIDAVRAGSQDEERKERVICKVKESIPILELLLALRNGDLDVAEECVRKIKEAEQALYGTTSQAEVIMDFYQMLFNSPDREMMQSEEHPDDDPEIVPDIPEDVLPGDRFRTLLGWVANCTAANWHKSAEDSAYVLMKEAINAGSDYHICMAKYMLAREYDHSGRVEEAVTEYKAALSVLEAGKYEPESDSCLSQYLYYAITLSLGELLKEINPEEALGYFDSALCYLDKENSSHQSFRLYISTSRAIALKNCDRIGEAEREFVSVLETLTLSISRQLPFLSGGEREKKWSDVQDAIGRVVAQLDNGSGRAFKTAAYNAVLFSKGFLFTTEKSIQRIVTESGIEEALRLYNLVMEENSASGTWGTAHTYDSAQYVDNYLNDVRLQLLIQEDFMREAAKPRNDFENVRSCLKPGEAIVDFYDVDADKFHSDRKYLAFITRPDADCPEVVETVRESSISDAGRHFAASLWEPLAPLLRDCTTIYFSPSGSLHKIAVESLPWGAGTLSEQYQGFHRISHAREIAVFANGPRRGPDGAIIIGGLKYDDSGISPEDNSGKRGYSLNRQTSCGDVSGEPVPWPFLPWSDREADNIEKIMKVAGKMECRKIKGFLCREDVLFELADGGPGLIHIATHGFCETVHTAQQVPALKGLFRPLDLTGLVLSYGNSGWLNGSKENHRGVVTASQIADLNLRNTELVVLSACFSGSGHIGQDGMYGLIRAFKKAGVRSILASLWEVDDKSSYFFMHTFYMALIVEGMSYRAAYEYAMSHTREDFPDPMYWAGYIFID